MSKCKLNFKEYNLNNRVRSTGKPKNKIVNAVKTSKATPMIVYRKVSNRKLRKKRKARKFQLKPDKNN